MSWFPTGLACAKGDYTNKVSAPSGSAGAPDELTDLAIALIVIFSLFVLVVLIVVVYKWKQILQWLAPFRPSLGWMTSETKVRNRAPPSACTFGSLAHFGQCPLSSASLPLPKN